MRPIIRAVLLAGLLTLNACAGMIMSEPILVDRIPGPEESNLAQTLSSVNVRLERFSDKRAHPEVARIRDKKLMPEGEVGTAVQTAFDRYIRARGGRVSLFDAAVTLTGEVREWMVLVTPGFPAAQLRGSAVINIEVFDAQNRSLYQAHYSGSMVMEHPLPQQITVEQVLGGAMEEAIAEAFGDARLEEALSTRAR